MAYIRTNIESVVEVIIPILEKTESEPLPLSDFKSKISKSDKIPETTKKKLYKYIENGVINGALVESRQGRYQVNSMSDVYWKTSSIGKFLKTGKPSKSGEPAKSPETKVVITDDKMEFPLCSEVYYMKDNKFRVGTIVGVIFLDTEKLDGLFYYVKEDNGNVDQFSSESLFKTLAELANFYLNEFKQRNPNYGKAVVK